MNRAPHPGTCAALLVLASLPALAQEYVPADATTPYATIADGQGSTLFTDSDDGFAAVELPFVFHFYGRAYGPGQASTTLYVSVNGAVAFAGRDAATGQPWPLPGANVDVPNTATPQGLVAALWDDFVAMPGAGSRVAWAIEGTAPSRTLVVDWRNVQLYAQRGSTAPTYSFALRLSEGSDRLEIRYGPRTGDTAHAPMSATVGVENALGTAGMGFAPCNPTCGDAQIPANSGKIYLPNTSPALSIAVAVDGSAGTGPSVLTRITNQGNSGGTAPYVLHLSSDPVLDANDPVVYTSAPLTVGPRPSSVSDRAVLNLGPTVLGTRYLIGVVDPNQTLPTLDRGPNTASSPPFMAGPDLQVEAVAPPNVVGGTHLTVNATPRNVGTTDVAAVKMRVLLSGVRLRTPRELLRTVSFALPALKSAPQVLDVLVPADLLPGPYSLSVQVDPDNAVAEGDETNDTSAPIAIQLAGPDVGVSDVQLGALEAYQGQAFPLRATLQNLGPAAATNFVVGVYVSKNDAISLYDQRLFLSPPMSLDPLVGSGGLLPKSVLYAVPVPADLAPGTYHVGVIADAGRVVPEAERANNTRLAETTLEVFAPAPDLAVADVGVQATAAAGETARVSGLIENLGSAPAQFDYAVVVSTNAIVLGDDAVLATGRLSLAPRAQQVLALDVPLPSTLPAGTYTVGIVLDAANAVKETDETNDAAAAAGTLTVTAPGLVVMTDALPDAVVGTPYDVRLAASGGTGRYAWRIVGGALPGGMSLDPTGRVSGAPLAPRTAAIVVEVKSDGVTALGAFSLLVRTQAASLGLVDDRLPAARVGRAYAAQLGAVGGTPPYRFSATLVPAGLALAADGTLSGIPEAISAGFLQVTLEDGAGNRTTGAVRLDVLDVSALSIGAAKLRDAQAGKAFAQTLNVQGGTAPYGTTLVDGALPPGLAFLADAQGQPTIAGTAQAGGTWAFTLAVTDATGARVLGTFAIRVNPRVIAFSTSTLAAAAPGAAYRETIGTNARPPATFALDSGDLPPGLEMAADGTISGLVPTEAARRLYPFSVRVSDASGGEAIGAFAIDVPLPEGHLPAESGCSNAGGGGLLALVFLLFFGRFRRAGVAMAALLVPALASAEYRVARTSQTFQPMSGGTLLFDGSAGYMPRATAVPLPFPFTYWGTTQDSVTVTTTGLLKFGSVTAYSENTPVPSGGEPTLFVAPFWDFFFESPSVPTGTSTVRWAIEGTAPNRDLVVEWRNIQRYGFSGSTYPAYSFQIRLYEGSNEITLDYGSVSAIGIPVITATMGLQGPGANDGFDLSDNACSPGCPASAFPTNSHFRLALAPDLGVVSVSAPASLFLDADSVVRTTLRNTGGADAVGATVLYKLSRDRLDDGCTGDPANDALRACDDVIIGTSSPASVLRGQTATIETHLVVPSASGLTPGIYQLLATVDAQDAIPEVNDGDNAAPARQVVLSAAAPDYVVTSLLGGPVADAGGTYRLTRSIKNQGNRTGHGRFVTVLSSNAQASASDLVLERKDNLTLAAGAVLAETVNLTIPADVTPGTYWVGVLVRPGDGENELDALNDDGVFGPITIRGDALALTTSEIPPVTVGVPFTAQLVANRPLGNTAFSAGFPPPPDGVQVSRDGVVSGVVGIAGEWPMAVQASSGGTIVSKTYRLRATGGSAPLTLATTRLPVGETAKAYETSLIALGGAPPYLWGLEAPSALPAGLALAPDGTLEGLPLVDGPQSFRVRVTDSKSATVSGEIVVTIAGPQRPMFVTEELPVASLETAYSVALAAVGGTRPYAMSMVETRRLPSAPGEVATSTPAAPPGLTLSAEGVLAGTPTAAGTYLVTVSLLDAQRNGATATWLLAVSEGSGPSFVVTTRTLPDAIVGAPYAAALATTGASGAVAWEAVFVNGVALPAGLSFDVTGRVLGTPSVLGTASFLAVARDEAGRRAVRALGVRVVPAPLPAESSGCAAIDGSVFALLGFAILLRRRFAVVAGLALVACTAAPPVPCPAGCPAGLTCDTTDSLCKCGGHGGAVCGPGETCDVATKSCVAPSCLEGCPSGTSCGADGACHCGSASGEVCGDGKTCGTAGRCESRNPCAGVTCAAGLTCDPTHQGECRCGPGGPACAAGERCRNGACVADNCVGVACAGGTVCDPADGQCRCGGHDGAVCVLGEACDVETSRCVPSAGCAAVTCPAGEACDPIDATCRCAGPGGPRCAGDQWCDPRAKQCLGGDRCASVTCGAGLSCDPEDGLCKCGGHGGVACTAAEKCVVSGARTMCVLPCDPVLSDGCRSGVACAFDELAGLAYCQTPGTAHEAEACGPGHTCGPGLHCTGAYVNSPGHCEPYCTTDDDCAPGFWCIYFGDAPPGACTLRPTP